ncbi:DUF2078 family protein (plasmid) [Halobacterium hubeiense]|uniref:DUF2078 family protein n=2 Tax=Halobacterium hubeiense TaxID=1407499 RepID=A0A0U5H7F4_9EURY|nr:hypothetical protein [Halobacterium hubeiense]CQH64279.1 DUF2078 family protein [Halobacterium hubeiense]
MTANTSSSKILMNEDHWITLVAAIVTVGGLGLLSDLPWFWLLVAGMVVSGVVEFVIREIPPDRDNYDPAKYRLWDAGFGQDSETNNDNN